MKIIIALAFYFLLLILFQKIMLVFQMKSIQKEIKDFKKKGYLSIGLYKGSFGFKKYYAIISDEKGNIVASYILNGKFIWSRFKKNNGFSFKTVQDAQNFYKHRNKKGKEKAISDSVNELAIKLNLDKA